MSQGCSNHSGICVNIDNLNTCVQELKLDMEKQKGIVEGRFIESSKETKELRKELTDKMDLGFKKLEDKIDAQATGSDNKKLIWATSLLSPVIVGVLLLLAQHFIK
jgi:hypothetical protein